MFLGTMCDLRLRPLISACRRLPSLDPSCISMEIVGNVIAASLDEHPDLCPILRLSKMARPCFPLLIFL